MKFQKNADHNKKINTSSPPTLGLLLLWTALGTTKGNFGLSWRKCYKFQIFIQQSSISKKSHIVCTSNIAEGDSFTFTFSFAPWHFLLPCNASTLEFNSSYIIRSIPCYNHEKYKEHLQLRGKIINCWIKGFDSNSPELTLLMAFFQ